MDPAAALIVDCAFMVHVTLLVGWQRPQRRGRVHRQDEK
jgi:hypothetical protein